MNDWITDAFNLLLERLDRIATAFEDMVTELENIAKALGK